MTRGLPGRDGPWGLGVRVCPDLKGQRLAVVGVPGAWLTCVFPLQPPAVPLPPPPEPESHHYQVWSWEAGGRVGDPLEPGREGSSLTPLGVCSSPGSHPSLAEGPWASPFPSWGCTFLLVKGCQGCAFAQQETKPRAGGPRVTQQVRARVEPHHTTGARSWAWVSALLRPSCLPLDLCLPLSVPVCHCPPVSVGLSSPLGSLSLSGSLGPLASLSLSFSASLPISVSLSLSSCLPFCVSVSAVSSSLSLCVHPFVWLVGPSECPSRFPPGSSIPSVCVSLPVSTWVLSVSPLAVTIPLSLSPPSPPRTC